MKLNTNSTVIYDLCSPLPVTVSLWQPCSQHWNADQELPKQFPYWCMFSQPTLTAEDSSPLVSFCSSHQPPLLSHIILLPWTSRCEKHLTVPQSEVSHRRRRAVTRGPVPRPKNSCVSLQVNQENLIVSEQHSKPQVVQSWFWAQVFSLNSCHSGTLKLCRQEPWQMLRARACFLLYQFPCRSQYRQERIQGQFSRFKLGCTHSCPACANCQQLEHMHCSHLPRGIPLQLGKAVVWLQGHPVAFNAELDGPMHFAESFLFSKPSLVLFQATNTSLNSPGLETTSQLMDRRRKNSRQHSNCYFFHLHIFYHVYPF